MTTQIPHFIDGRRSNLSSTRTADVLTTAFGSLRGPSGSKRAGANRF